MMGSSSIVAPMNWRMFGWRACADVVCGDDLVVKTLGATLWPRNMATLTLAHPPSPSSSAVDLLPRHHPEWLALWDLANQPMKHLLKQLESCSSKSCFSLSKHPIQVDRMFIQTLIARPMTFYSTPTSLTPEKLLFLQSPLEGENLKEEFGP